jgi:hypothetical protein
MGRLDLMLDEISVALPRKNRGFLSRMRGSGRVEEVVLAIAAGETGGLAGADQRLYGLLSSRADELVAAFEADTEANAGLDLGYVPYETPTRVVEPAVEVFQDMVDQALRGLSNPGRVEEARGVITTWDIFVQIADGDVPARLKALGGYRAELVNRAAEAVRGFQAQATESK